MTVLFVEYPKCSTCKKAKVWLDEHGVEYIDRDIVTDNPAADELATWIARSGLPVRRFFNSSGMKYRELGLKARLDAGMTDQECCELLATDGMLVKRPLLAIHYSRYDNLIQSRIALIHLEINNCSLIGYNHHLFYNRNIP